MHSGVYQFLIFVSAMQRQCIKI